MFLNKKSRNSDHKTIHAGYVNSINQMLILISSRKLPRDVIMYWCSDILRFVARVLMKILWKVFFFFFWAFSYKWVPSSVVLGNFDQNFKTPFSSEHICNQIFHFVFIFFSFYLRIFFFYVVNITRYFAFHWHELVYRVSLYTAILIQRNIICKLSLLIKVQINK